MIRKWMAFLLAVVVTYILAAAASTQSVLANLNRMGAEVSLIQRLEAIAHDLIGMATSFLPLVAVALLIAFIVTGIAHRRLRKWRIGLYVIAGATAIIAIHLILHAAFHITPVAAARTVFGLAVQGVAGMVGGYVFVRLRSVAN